MPRIQLDYPKPLKKINRQLVEKLSSYLTQNDYTSIYQPLIYEYKLQKSLLRVIVIWDEWKILSLEERTAIILAAYSDYEAQNIALASGLTVPEGVMAGFLPFRVIPALRKTDQINQEHCWEIMTMMNASILFEENEPHLYFATKEESEKFIEMIERQYPETQEVWSIVRETTSTDFELE
jgi:hypothetical protein